MNLPHSTPEQIKFYDDLDELLETYHLSLVDMWRDNEKDSFFKSFKEKKCAFLTKYCPKRNQENLPST